MLKAREDPESERRTGLEGNGIKSEEKAKKTDNRRGTTEQDHGTNVRADVLDIT